ncbi:hypothetical protein TRIUR3_07127 [Triticum urartu]|uniref:S1-like domain-containing protein n=1 Tax=Triticum urartu TaxID=4572 RepID=M7ZFF3_TRIUA|nr:hypothetical protein TRIUR3_07127 [Triticum urartu]
MKGGRKNLRRACEEGTAVTLAEGESIMQVVTLRGSNLIEVTDGEGVKSLALFPAKFQKSFWIKNGFMRKEGEGVGRLRRGLGMTIRHRA